MGEGVQGFGEHKGRACVVAVSLDGRILGQWLLTSDPSTRNERPSECQIPTHWMEGSGWQWRRQQEVFTAMFYENEKMDELGILSPHPQPFDLKPSFIIFVNILKLPPLWLSSRGVHLTKNKVHRNLNIYLFIFKIFKHIYKICKYARMWKQPKCPSTDEWIEMSNTYTMEYYSAIEKNEILLFAVT